MKLVSISNELLHLYSSDKEILQKSGRPYVAVLHLHYRDRIRDFAIPIRSNISAAAPKNEYFALPPRPSTRPYNRHGLHYAKMFPVSKQYLIKYRTEGNEFATLLENIINKNERQIVMESQQYLNHYISGDHPRFSTDLDLLLKLLENYNSQH